MRKLTLLLTQMVFAFSFGVGMAMANDTITKRVPAEWEEQEATWLQWPGTYEKSYEEAYAQISKVIVEYQKLHILVPDEDIEYDARRALTDAGANPDHQNITWHFVPTDSAWMRDNGPTYVIENGEMRLQNWEFDAWGGAWGPEVTYDNDNEVPYYLGEYLNLPVDHVDIVHERGNLEFNGVDTVLLNWSTLGDPRRNPGYTKEEAIADLKHQFGVSKVIMTEGVVEGDLTNGHIDGIARFINETTVVIPECTEYSICRPNDATSKIYDKTAKLVEEEGFTVIRDPIEGTGSYKGEEFDAVYMNWLLGNGFVIAVGFGNPEVDALAKERLESYFPGRDVYIIEMLKSWYAGGGVHCHTNDQPAMSVIKG
ncbi:agmatine deiminase family protein [Curvivirga sp.]|uniref:agmatine deiminase family protein n=1 Tax=Curvivirga sp. TaxID=2856848 RepID=UPI003B5B1764